MAELTIHIGSDHPHFEDGDIKECWNNRRILAAYTESICQTKDAGFTFWKLRPDDCLSKCFDSNIYQYKFKRISKNEVLRIDQKTGEVSKFRDPYYSIKIKSYPERKIYGLTFGKAFSEYCATVGAFNYTFKLSENKIIILNEDGIELTSKIEMLTKEHIDVEGHLFSLCHRWNQEKKRWQFNNDHRVYGTEEKCEWFGGKIDLSLKTLEKIWKGQDGIERQTDLIMENHFKTRINYPYFKKNFIVSIEDISDKNADETIESELEILEENNNIPKMIKARKKKVNWRKLPGLSIQTTKNISDRTKFIDGRNKARYNCSQIVLEKSI